MILTDQKDNHLYLVIQDFEDDIETVYSKIQTFPSNTPNLIKKILDKNFFSVTLERQRSYISSITTYIDGIYENDQQYFLHLYILPKDLDIQDNETDTDEQKIEKCEQLSFKLFNLYSQLGLGERGMELFRHDRGKSFLQLEAAFYIDKLDRLYSYLLNYKAHHANKVICSDKKIGIEIYELNRLESNPLKNYQFIKVAYQKELIHFIYSILSFLKKFRIEVFRSTCDEEFGFLHKKINRINNLLLKISTHKDMVDNGIKNDNDSLEKYLKQNKNKKEIKRNRKIFTLIESIFYTQLSEDVQFFQSLDLPTIFEKITEQKLVHYSEKLYIGDEKNKQITFKGKKDKKLNNENFLVKVNGKKRKRQYPDFLLKDDIEGTEVYHIMDAKYKLVDKVVNEADIRQILVYSILFNKAYSKELSNQKNIKKVIVYADKSVVDLDNIDTLSLNTDPIDLFDIEPDIICNDNVLDSQIEYIGIKTLKNCSGV
ncbi:hypothetical protein [Sulfurovum sp. AR]|uniref:hypothetical protein n=1 Tax=Sulfurovum sp. AR TaxID=1165841 RepID=UPI00025C4CC9|nr:hypothetical protein [Sulfurovum sp. AR]EIF51377.1 hypothetical protein SULAR_03997 [Sulfurovum sp. AR]